MFKNVSPLTEKGLSEAEEMTGTGAAPVEPVNALTLTPALVAVPEAAALAAALVVAEALSVSGMWYE
jgi:hypothetical protein